MYMSTPLTRSIHMSRALCVNLFQHGTIELLDLRLQSPDAVLCLIRDLELIFERVRCAFPSRSDARSCCFPAHAESPMTKNTDLCESHIPFCLTENKEVLEAVTLVLFHRLQGCSRNCRDEDRE